MTNNLNLLTTDEFFSSMDSNLDMDLVTLIDIYTGESVNYLKVTFWLDGTAISTNETRLLDGVIYRKKLTGSYYAREVILQGASINIKWFGAQGNGNVDNAVVFNRISDFVFEQRKRNVPISSIFVPNGRFMTTAIFDIPLKGCLYGESSTNSIILGDIEGPLLRVLESKEENPVYDQTGKTIIKDLSLGGKCFNQIADEFPDSPAGFRPNKIGIYISRALRVELDNLFIKGFEGYGVMYDRTYYQTLRGCYFTCNAVGVWANECTSFKFDNCEFRKNSRGLHIIDSYSFWVKNGIFEENIAKFLVSPNDPLATYQNSSSTSIFLQGSKSFGITISECYFEADLRNIIFDNSVCGNIVRGCYFSGSSKYQLSPDYPRYNVAVFDEHASENLFEYNTHTTLDIASETTKFRFFPQAKNNLFKFLYKKDLNNFIIQNQSEFQNSYVDNNIISYMPIATVDSANQKFERNKLNQIRPYIETPPTNVFINDILIQNGEVFCWDGTNWVN